MTPGKDLVKRLRDDAAAWDAATIDGAAETRALLREAAKEIEDLRRSMLTCEPDHSHIPFPAYRNDGPRVIPPQEPWPNEVKC